MKFKVSWKWLGSNHVADCRKGAKAHAKAIDMDGEVLAVDLSVWLSQTTLCKKEDIATCNKCIDVLLTRVKSMMSYGVLPVVVLGGLAPVTKGKRSTSSELEGGSRSRLSFIEQGLKSVLEALGLPCVEAPGEAAAMCAALQREGLVHSCITKNVDALLYGAEHTYKTLVLQPQNPLKTVVEECTARALAEFLKMDEKDVHYALIAIALLLKGDHNNQMEPSLDVAMAVRDLGREIAASSNKLCSGPVVLLEIRRRLQQSHLETNLCSPHRAAPMELADGEVEPVQQALVEAVQSLTQVNMLENNAVVRRDEDRTGDCEHLDRLLPAAALRRLQESSSCFLSNFDFERDRYLHEIHRAEQHAKVLRAQMKDNTMFDRIHRPDPQRLYAAIKTFSSCSMDWVNLELLPLLLEWDLINAQPIQQILGNTSSHTPNAQRLGDTSTHTPNAQILGDSSTRTPETQPLQLAVAPQAAESDPGSSPGSPLPDGEYEVEDIVGHIYDGPSHEPAYYIVKWVGYDSQDNTPESIENLKNSPDILSSYKAKIQLPPNSPMYKAVGISSNTAKGVHSWRCLVDFVRTDDAEDLLLRHDVSIEARKLRCSLLNVYNRLSPMETSKAKAIMHDHSMISPNGESSKRKLLPVMGQQDMRITSLTEGKKPKSEGMFRQPVLSIDWSPEGESISKVPKHSGSTDVKNGIGLLCEASPRDHVKIGETPADSTKAAVGDVQSSTHHTKVGESVQTRSPDMLHRVQATSVPSGVLPCNSVRSEPADVTGSSSIPMSCENLQAPLTVLGRALEPGTVNAVPAIQTMRIECAESDLTEVPTDEGGIPSEIVATPAIDVGRCIGGGFQERQKGTGSVDNGDVLNTARKQECQRLIFENEQRRISEWGRQSLEIEDSSDEDFDS